MVEFNPVSEDDLNTDKIEACKNAGCGFNLNSICTASGTTCFGFIPVKSVGNQLEINND